MTSCCMWFVDWGTPIKNPGYADARIQEVFMFGFFPFNQSKTMLSSSREQDIFEDL